MALARVKVWAAEILTYGDLNDEFNSILNNPGSLICPITFNLTFTDATYDIGASGATRPRDLYLSRNAVIGGDLSAATASGAVVATQAQMETGTATTLLVTPGRQQYHPSAAKGWLKAVSNSTTIEASYNVTSVDDTATGAMTINWATDFSGGDYCAVTSAVIDQGGADATTYATTIGATGLAAGVTRMYMARVSDGALTDPSRWMCVAFGDQ